MTLIRLVMPAVCDNCGEEIQTGALVYAFGDETIRESCEETLREKGSGA